MDENDVQNAREGLSMIVDWFDEGGKRQTLGTVKFFALIAEKLNALAGRDWSWRYIQSVHAGSTKPSVDMARAILALGATLDDAPAAVAYTVTVRVLTRPGAVPDGTLILGEARPCAWRGCRVMFVPKVPWQKYCSAALHEAAERERKAAGKNG